MNDALTHHGVWHNAWTEINELEGEVIKERDEDLFEKII